MELESKFIEGTNNQYSIRNDGVVIGHYRYDKWGNKLIKNRVIKSYTRYKKNSITVVAIFGFPQKQHSVRELMETYFNIEGIPSKILGYKDENKENYHLSNLYYVQPKDIREVNKSARDKAISNITKWYVASKLGLPVSSLTNELYELHKALILLKRLIKSKKKCQILQ